MRSTFTIDEAIEACKQRYKDKNEFKKFADNSHEFKYAFEERKKSNPDIKWEDYVDLIFDMAQQVGRATGII